MNNLTLRLLTALILVPVVLAALFFMSTASFTLACAIVMALGFVEWARLCQLKAPWDGFSFVLFLCISGLLFYFNLNMVSYFALAWFIPLLAIAKYQPRLSYSTTLRAMAYLLGIVLLQLAWQSLVLLKSQSPFFVLAVFLVVWSTDTFAYFAGRQWGKTPLAAHISPKKTMAGLYGGLSGATVVGILSLVMILPHPSTAQTLYFVGIVLVCSFLSVMGDLFESLLKRLANVKDSGTWLPGHGGILDRIDGLIAALPFFYLGMIWIKQL